MEALPAADPKQVGPYRMLGRLGSGGMGQVFLGVSPTADRVAVKVIKSPLLDDADFRERFALEVVNLKTVYGARVARFEGAGLNDEPPWLAVEYIEGPTLRQYVERSGPLEVALAAATTSPSSGTQEWQGVKGQDEVLSDGQPDSPAFPHVGDRGWVSAWWVGGEGGRWQRAGL